jgi:ELWxxDGT repeat protein
LLYFVGEDQASGREMWISDFTASGTRMAADLYAGGSNSNPKGFVAFDDAVLFTAQSPLGSGHEAARVYLWSYDGQTAAPLVDVPICNAADIEYLAPRDGVLYFAGRDDAHGCELWQYDGTDARIVADIASGPVDSRPGHFQTIGDAFYFTADDIEHGEELWRLVTVPDGDFTGDGNVGIADVAVIQRNMGQAADAVYAQGDINGDGAVNAADVAMLVARFGVSQPIVTSSAAPSAIVVARPRAAAIAEATSRFDAVARRYSARDAGSALGDAGQTSTLRTARRGQAQSVDATDAALEEASFDVGRTRRTAGRSLARR